MTTTDALSLSDLLSRVAQSDLDQTQARLQADADKRKALRLAANAHALSITELMQKLAGEQAPTDKDDLQFPKKTEEVPNVRPVAGTFPAPPTGPASSKPGV